MTRFEATTHPGLYWAIALSVVAVAIAQLTAPVGVAAWMLYVVPLALCFFARRAWVPLAVGGIATLLLVLDYFSSVPHVVPAFAVTNRAIGLVVIWATALQAANIISSRLRARQRRLQELRAQQEQARAAGAELQLQSSALREFRLSVQNGQAELEKAQRQLEANAQRLARQGEELAHAKSDLHRKGMELARAQQSKCEFLTNMSHELRAPLNSALILSKMLADNSGQNLTPEQVKFAHSIYSAGHDLLELINAVLDLSTLEAGNVELHGQTVEVADLVGSLVQTFGPLADRKRIGFDVALAPGVPGTFQSDPHRLRQLLENLLSNAVRFTERGSVSLHVGATDGRLEFEVRDTGAGIAPEQHAVVFEPFRRAGGGTERRPGGAGLGLAVAREIASLLGGRIELQSAPGAGSTFRLVVPTEAPATVAPPAPAPRAGASVPCEALRPSGERHCG